MASGDRAPSASGSASSVWTDNGQIVNDGLPGLTVSGTLRSAESSEDAIAEEVGGGAVFQRDTGTLVGLDDDASPSRSILWGPGANRDDLLVFRSYQLQVQGQRHQHAMQGWVLLGILVVIMTTLVLSIVAVGVHWITEGFAQHVLSLILTAALSGLGGAVAWAFRGATSSNGGEQGANQK